MSFDHSSAASVDKEPLSSPFSGHSFSAFSSPKSSPSTGGQQTTYHSQPDKQSGHSSLPNSTVPSCSLRLVFVLSSVLQVSIACILVWYIGYSYQNSTVSELSSLLRNQTMSHMIDQITSELAVPVLAVNEVDLNTEQRLISTSNDPAANFDWSTDDAYYTVLANILRHYPGVTASAMQASTAVLMTAAFVIIDSVIPPYLAFINQDKQSNWTWAAWISSYHQTLQLDELYSQSSILAAQASFFSSLPPGDLARGRAHPIGNFGYVPPEANVWWVACTEAAQPVLNGAPSTTNIVSWAIPKQTVNHSTTSTTETFSVCKPHIDFTPNITWYGIIANASTAANCPHSQYLLDQVANMTAQQNAGLPISPIVDYVADVTWDPYVLVLFMQERLNDFILENGACLVVTTTGWVIASTLPAPDLDVLVYLPDMFNPPTNNPVIADYVQYVKDNYSEFVPFLASVWNNLNSETWQNNFASVVNVSSALQISWEQTEVINGHSSYVQYALLGIPATSFSFVLVVYSRESDYQGNLVENSTLSGVLSAVVIIVSIIVTLILTQCVHQPILTLIEAMKSVVDPPGNKEQEEAQKKQERAQMKNLQLKKAWRLGLAGQSSISGRRNSKNKNDPSAQEGWKKKLRWNSSVVSRPTTDPGGELPAALGYAGAAGTGAAIGAAIAAATASSMDQLGSPGSTIPPSPGDQLLDPDYVRRTSSASVVVHTPVVTTTPSSDARYMQPLTQLPATATPLTTYRDIRNPQRSLQQPTLQYQPEVYSSYLPSQKLSQQPQQPPSASGVLGSGVEGSGSNTNSTPNTASHQSRSLETHTTMTPSVEQRDFYTQHSLQRVHSEHGGSGVGIGGDQGLVEEEHRHEAALILPAAPDSPSHDPALSPPNSPPAPPAPPAASPATVSYPNQYAAPEISASHSNSDREDVSSYELDLLLQKWQRTMIAQGVLSTEQWETDDPTIAMGLAAAKKKYQRQKAQRKQLAAVTHASPRGAGQHRTGGGGGAGAAGSSPIDANNPEADDQSVFSSGTSFFGLHKLIGFLFPKTPSPSPHNSSSHSHSGPHTREPSTDSQSYTSQHSDTSGTSDHSNACQCNKCQRHRLSLRIFSCGGQFAEVVRLQLTFGSMLLRLRNSAVKVEQANLSKRQFLRFIFHEVRVPLNALGLGVEQLHDEMKHQQMLQHTHIQHMAQQQQIQHRIQHALETRQYSIILTALQHWNVLQSSCPVCNGQTPSTDALSGNELISIIQDQVLTVTRILNDVLSFQRIEDGELSLEAQPFIVQAMITHTLHSFQAEFKHKQLRVSVEYRGTLVDDTLPLGLNATQGPAAPPSSVDSQSRAAKENEVHVDMERLMQPKPQSDTLTEEKNPGGSIEMHTLGGSNPAASSVSIPSAVNQWCVVGDPAASSVSIPSAVNQWCVVGDQYRLRQVLSNFVSNAVKFNPVGGSIQVVAELTRRKSLLRQPSPVPQTKNNEAEDDPEVAWLHISVIDSGIGINEGGLRSLFQPYHQIRPGAQQQGRGSGLGLSICKKLMELHGGQVLVSSTVGKGSNFSFRVPVAMVTPSQESKLIEQEDEFSVQPDKPQTTEQEDAGVLSFSHVTHSRDGTPLQEHRAIQIDPYGADNRITTALIPSAADRFNSAGLSPVPDSPPLVSPTTALETSSGQSISTGTSVSPSPNASPIETTRSLSVGSPLRALVVEDSVVNRKLLCMMLKSMGLDVDQAEDGLIAYQMIEAYISQQQLQPVNPIGLSCQYDVIFMDDHMPNWTGVQSVAAIRTLGVNTLIFGVTGNAIAEDLHRFRRAGVTDVVTKPVSKKQIVHLVSMAQQVRERKNKGLDNQHQQAQTLTPTQQQQGLKRESSQDEGQPGRAALSHPVGEGEGVSLSIAQIGETASE